MSHYWTANDPAVTRQAQIEDWLEDLTEFPIEHVEAACREWRRTGGRRPLPADIRVLAIDAKRRAAEREELRALPPPKPVTRPKTPNCWEPGYADRYDEPWFGALPADTQRRYKGHDLARAECHRVGTEEDFVALCLAQAKANLAGKLVGRGVSPSDRVREALGVSATEQRPKSYEDPEALRRGRIELGLEGLPD